MHVPSLKLFVQLSLYSVNFITFINAVYVWPCTSGRSEFHTGSVKAGTEAASENWDPEGRGDLQTPWTWAGLRTCFSKKKHGGGGNGMCRFWAELLEALCASAVVLGNLLPGEEAQTSLLTDEGHVAQSLSTPTNSQPTTGLAGEVL